MSRISPRRGVVGPALLCTLVAATLAESAEKASEQVSAFHGTFGYAVPIEVPAFRGLEPRLGLAYNSEGRNGFVGVGWVLGGFSTIQRANAGRGTPRFDSNDIYLLDGQEMIACTPTTVSPSCTTGGTHATKIESYQRVRFDSASNSWTVTAKDGTRTVFNPIVTTPYGTLRWGVSQRIDTLGNAVSYSWACVDGDCYPSQVSYNGYGVTLHREPRPDVLSHGEVSSVAQTNYRLRTILVHLGSTPIRGYKLSYSVSPVTGRSLLTSVTQYGKDVVLDGAGAITGGSSLPPTTFTYQNDAIAKGFHPQGPNPPTPPGTTEPVTWTKLENAYAWTPGNSLYKPGTVDAWDSGASSNRGISSGPGYVEWTAEWNGYKMVGLSNGDTNVSYQDIDFALWETYGGVVRVYESGVNMGVAIPVADGDKLRVEVEANQVKFKRNGTTYYTSTKTPVYPLLVDTSIGTPGAIIRNVFISGALQDVAHWCSYQLLNGDFNGDGWTDQLCQGNASVGVQVSLGSPDGFLAPTTWGTATATAVADFNGDGKADLVGGPDWWGTFNVALSTGTSFQAATFWGEATGWAPDGFPYSCRVDPAVVRTGDFNGDGKADVSCRLYGHSEVFIGISTGSSFAFSIWGQGFASENAAQEGALDFDGDGKDDWFVIGWGALYVNRSTGSSFIYDYGGSSYIAICNNSYVLGDLNGDGKTDAYCPANGMIAWSTGRQFVTQASSGAWCNTGNPPIAADVDGDAASELVCHATGGNIQVRKWTGTALGSAETWASNWCTSTVMAGDFNSDGKTDLFCRNQPFPVAFAGTSGVKADLVMKVTTPLGGSVQPAYAVSIAPPNANGPPAKYVVASMTSNDGRGVVATTSYVYSGGLYDRRERQFMGFRLVKETRPCAPGENACPTVETWLRQDLASAGSPDRVETRDGLSRLLNATTYDYVIQNTTPPLRALLTGVWAFTYDGSGTDCSSWPCVSGKRTYTSLEYDSYGNIVQAVAHGDFDTAADETTSVATFFPNTGTYIVDHIASRQVFAGVGTSGQKLAESRFVYDGAATWTQPPAVGLVTTASEWLDTESRYVSVSTVYDAWGNITSATDPTGRSTAVTYDSTHHVFPVIAQNLASETTSTTWDPVCAVPLQVTDANGQTATTQYDVFCRVTRTEGPLGTFGTTAYLDLGNPAQQRVVVEGPSSAAGTGNEYSIQYIDGLGRTHRTVTKGPALGQEILTEVGYERRGLTAWATVPYYAGETPVTTYYEYDTLGRLTRTILPDGNTITYSYGLWSTTSADEHGHAATARYDAYGRLVQSEAQGIEAEHAYDPLGRKTATTDHLGHSWSWSYDSLGRVIQQSDPNAGTSSFTYDDADRALTHTDAKGQQTVLGYDAAGRLATKATSEGVVTFTYNEPRPGYFNMGQVTSVQDPASVLKTDYDALGRPVRIERVLDGTSYIGTYRYDAAGRTTGKTYPDGDAVGTPADPIRYDAAGRLLTIPGIVNEVLYDAAGRPIRQTNANGTVTTWTWMPERGFLTRIVTTGTGTLQDLTYTPDPAGLLTQTASPFPNESWSYAYDNFHRLVSASNASNPAESQSFQYDVLGRMTNNSQVGAYTYPAVGQLRPHAPATVAGDAMTYDDNGNLVLGRNRTIQWNAMDLPSQINGTQFVYDGLGDRLKKVTGGSTSIYPLGDDYEITNGVITKHVSAPGIGIVAKRVSGATYWHHTDRQGSIQAVTDASGAEVLRKAYRPFGDRLADTGSHAESLGYIEQRRDEETGLIYLHARYYDPELGLFLSPDPAQAAMNSYGYSSGDPVNRSDPSGLCDLCPFDQAPPDEPFRVEFVWTKDEKGNDVYIVIATGGGGGFILIDLLVTGKDSGKGNGNGGGQRPPKTTPPPRSTPGSHKPPGPYDPDPDGPGPGPGGPGPGPGGPGPGPGGPGPGPGGPGPGPGGPGPGPGGPGPGPGGPGPGPGGPGPGPGGPGPSRGDLSPFATAVFNGVNQYNLQANLGKLFLITAGGGVTGGFGFARAVTVAGATIRTGIRFVPRLVNHHVFPQKFRELFRLRFGIDIDRYLVRIPERWHQRWVHGGPGGGGGRWNQAWEHFLLSRPNATTSQAWDHLLHMLNTIGLKGP